MISYASTLQTVAKHCAYLGNAFLFLLLASCGSGDSSPQSITSPPSVPEPEASPREGLWFERDPSTFWYRAIEESAAGLVGGGVAAADYDNDGDIDFYVVGGEIDPSHLYENKGNGTFVERAVLVGLAIDGWYSGPAFGDIDSDGDLDLFVSGIDDTEPRLFENRMKDSIGRFVDITAESGLDITARNTVSATFYDYDNDGWLDLATTHWNSLNPGADTQTLWRNTGNGRFIAATLSSGLSGALLEGDIDFTFTANFTDLDNDGDGDLLMAADYDESQVLRNNGDGTFSNITDKRIIIDQAGMGAAVGDFDNDGDMDWFVTSIYNIDENGTYFGNRMYQNDGSGVFADVTIGVADGGWGWGACAADFDNDGALDIAQTNGWLVEGRWDYSADNVRFFHNIDPSNLRFEERAIDIGFNNVSQGRGIACFDMNRDGKQDIVLTNNAADNVVVFRNRTRNTNHYVSIRLNGRYPNHFGVGSRVIATTEALSQIRELGGSNNYASHNPYEVHFGLGNETRVDIRVIWPDGAESEVLQAPVDRLITIDQPPPVNRLSVSRGVGGGTYAAGESVRIEAGPSEEGYYFSHWRSDNGGSFTNAFAPSTYFTMPQGSVTVVANYLPGVAADASVSVARRWNEVLLEAIRNDYARPTVHARNLFHFSAAVYDAWTLYDTTATPWLFGKERSGYFCRSDTIEPIADLRRAREEAISHAAKMLLKHRFAQSPGAAQTLRDINTLMQFLGFDVEDDELENGSPSALGRLIGRCFIEFGFVDGANEEQDYGNKNYTPVNQPLKPHEPGNPSITDLNRWQPLSLREFVDQAGNPSGSTPSFLSPEWGSVVPFALSGDDLKIYQRDGHDYWVYHDPGRPPMIDGEGSANYKWSHSLVAIWSSHLDPSDGVLWDISPASIGNIDEYPSRFEDHRNFFKTDGGDGSRGYVENPITREAYNAQLVPRGDYTRALAEFWADGPDSETPPGHWFVILNEVNDHPLLTRRFQGQGEPLSLLEWDVKAYFTLGGAMHDAAITAWGIKGWYDYVRPISAIRAMADRGQSSDPNLESFHELGIPLSKDFIELVSAADPLAGENGEHVGKIKLLAWRNPESIEDPATDVAGVGWILAENWWPYQRPTFVTPPFAGYVSGHSTYSRAAAEVLSAITGSAFFPGGMSDFQIKAGEFLVFEDGPSVDLVLQWATYRDAADQCSLSRIWGGIHPPADDLPGRQIGFEVGNDAFNAALGFFSGELE
ncbi:MAG: FG-GAP-like repeat-containing protein [Gammaproteobacteria bacterium]|nr:FG-GAP-like repeat-containing protein [Gammaproteobacteria bacterium]